MKYYLAARFHRREEMEEYAGRISAAFGPPGTAVCTARWVYGGEEGLNRIKIADLDLEDIHKADTLIIFTEKYGSKFQGGGRFVEMGYALALRKRVIVIGDRENVFCHFADVDQYQTLEAFLHAEAPVV
jgi:nucleoside 2-deoxyribosyltransferase